MQFGRVRAWFEVPRTWSFSLSGLVEMSLSTINHALVMHSPGQPFVVDVYIQAAHETTAGAGRLDWAQACSTAILIHVFCP